MAYGQYTRINRKTAVTVTSGTERKRGCMLDSCYYQRKQENVNSECYGCPYGRTQLCIGWCTRKILRSK